MTHIAVCLFWLSCVGEKLSYVYEKYSGLSFLAFVHRGKAFQQKNQESSRVQRQKAKARHGEYTCLHTKYTFYCQVHIFQRTGPAVQAAYVRIVLCTLFMFPYTFSKRTGMQASRLSRSARVALYQMSSALELEHARSKSTKKHRSAWTLQNLRICRLQRQA